MALKDVAFGCHGIPERCFTCNGKPLPFCARCLGAGIGHIIAIGNFILFPLPPLSVAVTALSLMLADWWLQNRMKAYHSNVSRLLTGLLGGYGCGVFIWKGVESVLKIFK